MKMDQRYLQNLAVDVVCKIMLTIKGQDGSFLLHEQYKERLEIYKPILMDPTLSILCQFSLNHPKLVYLSLCALLPQFKLSNSYFVTMFNTQNQIQPSMDCSGVLGIYLPRSTQCSTILYVSSTQCSTFICSYDCQNHESTT